MKKQSLLVAFSLIPTKRPFIFPEDCENPVKQIQLLTALENKFGYNETPNYITPLDSFTLPAPIPLVAGAYIDFDAITYDTDQQIFVETTFVNEAKKRDNGQ